MMPRVLLAVLLGALFPRLSGAETAVPRIQRVVVFDIQADGVSGSNVSQLPDLMEQIVASHPGYQAIPAAETHRVLSTREARQPGCALSEACRWRVAHDLHADLMLSGFFAKRDRGFALFLALTEVNSQKPPTRASQTMKQLKSLTLNVTLCLNQLFGWNDTLASVMTMAAPATTKSAPEIPSEPLPPIVDEPSPSPVAEVKSAKPAAAAIVRRRLLIIPFEAIGVDPTLVTPLPSLVGAELGKYREYDVVTTEDLRHLSSMQDQKRKGGCTQDQACLTEIGSKLKADLVLTGSVGQVGTAYLISLSISDAHGLGMAKRATETATSRDVLPQMIAPCVARLLGPPKAMAAFHLPKGKSLKFAIFDIKPTGLTPQVAQNLTQVLSTEVKGIEGTSVISRADIAAILQLDEAKQQAGCDDDSCMVAIGGALGVDRLITGDAGKVGALYLINLRLIDVRLGVVENRVTETFNGDEEQLLRAVRKAGRDLLGVSSNVQGKLAVTSNQTAAEVFLDDKPAGKAPALFPRVAPRRHEVRVAQPGYYDWHGDVYVDPLETTSVWAELNARPQAWYQKWWVWTGAGVVAAGVVTGILFATRPGAATSNVNVGIQAAH